MSQTDTVLRAPRLIQLITEEPQGRYHLHSHCTGEITEIPRGSPAKAWWAGLGPGGLTSERMLCPPPLTSSMLFTLVEVLSMELAS